MPSLCHTVSFLGRDWRWSHGSFYRELLESFSWYCEVTRACLPRRIVSVRRSVARCMGFLMQWTAHRGLQDGAVLRFLLVFPRNGFWVQGVASVTFVRFLRIHNFMICHPGSEWLGGCVERCMGCWIVKFGGILMYLCVALWTLDVVCREFKVFVSSFSCACGCETVSRVGEARAESPSA